jgi:single-strand DNA-binding protein
MKNLKNSVRLIGNLGSDPEVRTLSDGRMVARFSLATSEAYKNKKGEKVSETQWHKIVAWGNMAKIAEKVCKKGYRVAVDGKLTNRSYDDSKGTKKYISEVVADELMVVNGERKSE